MNRRIKLLKIAAAMPDHRPAKRLKSFRGDLDRPGDKKLRMHGGAGKVDYGTADLKGNSRIAAMRGI